jgi:SAM-dependent methyltransferase
VSNQGIHVREESYILDFGCGDDHRVYQLLDCGFTNSFGSIKADYTGMENPVRLRRSEDIQFFRFSNDGIIPFPDGFVDLIISNRVFEHVFDQEKALREIHRLLKKGV